MRLYHLGAGSHQARRVFPDMLARTIAAPRLPPQPSEPRLLLGPVGGLLALWRRRSRERRQLARLDARLLRDIGITPGEAAAECNKPFWRG